MIRVPRRRLHPSDCAEWPEERIVDSPTIRNNSRAFPQHALLFERFLSQFVILSEAPREYQELID
jgi:hypothetical protein